MSGGVGIAAFIVTLFVMIMIHESGHFLAARAFGIKVEEFFIGFGPKLLSWRRGETEYGLKAILLGGYVRIAGMNPWQTIPESDLPRTFGAKPAWQRAILLVAGSATHFVVGVVIMIVALGVVGEPFPSTRIDTIQATVGGVPGPAKVAGLRSGDRIVEVDRRRIATWDDFREVVRRSPGQPVTIIVERNGRQQTVVATPMAQKDPQGGSAQVGVLGIAPAFVNERRPLPRAVVDGIKTTGEFAKLSVLGIGKVFSPTGVRDVVDSLGGTGARGIDSPVGLVGIARQSSEAAEQGNLFGLLAFFTSFIVFVGIINLAPLPPLDGGHLLVLLIEKIRGRPVDMRKVVPVAAVVLGFLMLFTFALLYLDIRRPVVSPF
jgi:membrane-associated protease RseP (regulator of RpoE activity)